jgi:outer membrane protein insertion porin family
VVRIEFVGNDLFSTASLKQLMGLKEGQRFDEAALDDDMALLARYFETTRVVRTDVPGGVVLTFEVRENPLVVDVVIRGAAELKEADIRKMLRTKAGYPLFPHLLAADAAEVAAAYRLKGYAFAQVPQPLVTTPPEGGRRVEFTIVEGPKVEVDRIVFLGATSIRRKDLLEVMQTKEREFWDFMSGKIYREDALREDIVALTRLYQDEGFLDAEVALGDQRFSDDKERVEITIVIQEHQPYRVGKVKVEIERPEEGREGSCTTEDCQFLTEERLAQWLGVAPGQRWSGKVATRGRERIREELYRRSYLSAIVREPELRGHEQDLVVDVTLKVTLGWKFRLRRIDFVGNEFTRDSFLRQEVCVAPGGYVDRNQLERGQARLRRTGYFARVGLEIEDVPSPEGEHEGSWKDARYEIVEQKTGKLGFQVGLSTSGGLFGSVSFQKRNFDIARLPRSWHDLVSGRAFTGNGQTFDAVLSPGTETTSFLVGFTEPRFFGSDFSFSARIYDRIENRNEYLINRIGYQVGFGYPVIRRDDDTLLASVGVRWRQEWIEVYDLEADAVPGAWLFAGHNELRGIRAYATVRAQDDVRRPRREFTANAGVELTGAGLGGDISELRIDGEASQLWALPEDDEGRHQTITARARVGYARALDDTPEVPPFERWFLGGNDFRGFARRGMGPHIFTNPTGGEWMLMGTLEFSQPLFGDTISLVAFTDFGTLGTAIDEDDAWKWRWTVGPGLRIKVPALGPNPLAFDFGFVIFDEDEDERQLLSFSVARDF